MFGKFVIAYIDDILIYSPSKETHVPHVKQVLTHVLQKQLFFERRKVWISHFLIAYLEYIINIEWVLKVTAVKDWPIPIIVKEL